ncbi:anoctamin-7-like [Globicephala melas]|uniref:anoctamin-7-like n=1 Tax=Globicephala melas TaxID=9731 RepID=UPI003872FC54
MTPPPASTPCHETDLGEQCPEGGMGLRAQDKSELCGGKSPEAQAGRRRWCRGQGPEDDRLCASRCSICVPDSGGNIFRDWKTEIGRRSCDPRGGRGDSDSCKRSWRDKFQRNLSAAGLLLEECLAKRRALAVYFAKLCALGAAGRGTEPAPDVTRTRTGGGGSYCGAFACCNLCSNTCPISHWTIRRSKLDLSRPGVQAVPERLPVPDSHPFNAPQMLAWLQNTQPRLSFVAEILARTIYGKEERAKMVMARLLTEGVYTAAFPLREGPCDLPGYQVPGADLNPPQLLYSYWACWGCWQKYQPLHHIQEDFGDKAAIYFGWCIWCWGEEICASRSSFLVCSICDTCATWNISEICPMAKMGYLFDHLGTVFFSIFMCFWATAFLEHWKHKSTTLAHHWDCSDFQEEEECPHPEFAALAPQMAQNPVTGLKEPYFPPHTRLPRLLTSSAAILIMLCVLMIFLVSVIIYCGIISIAMFHTANSVLMTQLFIITVGKQLVSNVQEFVVLKLKTWRQKRHLAGLQDTQIRQEQRRWEEDCELIEFKGQFDEYLEMVQVHHHLRGSLPTGTPICSAQQLGGDPTGHPEVLCEYWWLAAERTRLLLLEAIAYLSVIVNGNHTPCRWENDRPGLNAVGRGVLGRGGALSLRTRWAWLGAGYKGFRDAQRNLTLFYWKLLAVRLGFIIAFEHVVFFLGLIAWLVPDVPAALATKIKRER